MRILAVGDFHGRCPIDIRKICKDDKIELILSPGDFCYMDKIRKVIFANYDSRKRWYNIAGHKKAKELIAENVERGVELLTRMSNIGVPVFYVVGNAELTDMSKWYKQLWPYLKQDFFTPKIRHLKNLHSLEYSKIKFKELSIIGYGDSNSGPEVAQYKKISKYKLTHQKEEYYRTCKKVSKLFDKVREPIIFLTHNVPFKTSLDKITSPKAPESVRGKHYGSLVVRKMIDKYQPLLCICGHMHENQRVTKIGKTKVVNCGYGAEGEYAIINITPKQVRVKLIKAKDKS